MNMKCVIIQKGHGVLPGFADFTIFKLVHDELSSLTGGINDEWITIKSLNHDSVLCTQVISR